LDLDKDVLCLAAGTIPQDVQKSRLWPLTGFSRRSELSERLSRNSDQMDPGQNGPLRQTPHYLPEELDEECERIIMEFLKQKYGSADFPIGTDDLTVLIEQKADLDSYADLSHEEGDVEGVTEFTPGQRPVVKIADRLNVPNMENRLRTTLTHEWGHVHLH